MGAIDAVQQTDQPTIPTAAIEVNPRELARALTRAGKVASERSNSWPAVRIRAQQRARLAAASLHTLIEVDLDAEVSGPVDCLVSYAALRAAIKLFVGNDTVALCPLETGIEIRAGQRRYAVPGAVEHDWPEWPETWTPVLEASATEFAAAILAVSPHASVDDTRPTLTAIRLEHRRGRRAPLMLKRGARALATDTFRMCWAPLPGALDHFEVSLPARELTAAIAKPGEQECVQLELDQATDPNPLARLTRAGETWHLSSVPGQYPDYQNVVPEQHEVAVTIEREALLSVVDAACVVAGSSRVPLRIGVEETQLSVRVSVPDGASFEDVVSAQVVGEHDWSEIGVNPKFYRDALRSLDSDTVEIQLVNPNRPVLTLGGDRVVLTMQIQLTD